MNDPPRPDRKRFIETHRHILAGWVVDAALNERRGPLMAAWLRTMMQDMDQCLARMYDELVPKPAEPIANGKATTEKATNGKR